MAPLLSSVTAIAPAHADDRSLFARDAFPEAYAAAYADAYADAEAEFQNSRSVYAREAFKEEWRNKPLTPIINQEGDCMLIKDSSGAGKYCVINRMAQCRCDRLASKCRC